jgi:RNA polymerase II subunit A small phosphatase-like protein
MDSRALLILDIDETLIHATEKKLDGEPDFMCYDYHVYRRPHLVEFLLECQENFDMAVWSSATEGYVERIVDNIFPAAIKLEFVWSRSRCTRKHEPETQDWRFVKNLRKVKRLGFDLNRMLIIDDDIQSACRNYGNVIYVQEFLGDPHDRELFLLKDYLKTLSDVENVRAIEKRSWKSEFTDE